MHSTHYQNIGLGVKEIEALEKLHKNIASSTVRKHSHCLLLSHQRRKITDMLTIFDVNRRTIEEDNEGNRRTKEEDHNE